MNHRYGILYLFFVISAALTLAEETVHIVRRGETIYSIARSYGVDNGELMRFNGITDALKLQIGQQVKIPAKPEGAAGFIEYRAIRGDTLYSIARRYEITLESLRIANSLENNYVLKEGDMLRIPQSGPASPAEGTAGSTGSTGGTAGTALPAASGGAPLQVTEGTATVTDPRSTAVKAIDGSLRWPISAKEIFYMTGKLYGVVLLGERSEPVKSLTQGTVVSAGPYRGFGRVVIIQVAGGYLYVYGGCESLSVKEGDRIAPGTELGKLGIDAVSEKPQLFFLVYRSNTPIDPAKAPRA
ncbi:MAG: M23 family metallopeptidase [Treponema sp.]|jgi:murein DD-endopeptidase MepM/ murein hydrolase activator NlpD|nr:M23 family metallopeptidase [Treponema sp.]